MSESMPSSSSIPSSHENISDYDKRSNSAWFVSFVAAMVPFSAFCYGHHKGVTVRVLERLSKTNGGVYAIFALPFLTLSLEKCVYDTAQSIQGISPNIRPDDRGGFPSGGAMLPSFSLCEVQKTNLVDDFIQRQLLSTEKFGEKNDTKSSSASARNK